MTGPTLCWAITDPSGLYLWHREGGFRPLHGPRGPPPLCDLWTASDYNAAQTLCADLRRTLGIVARPVRMRTP